MMLYMMSRLPWSGIGVVIDRASHVMGEERMKVPYLLLIIRTLVIESCKFSFLGLDVVLAAVRLCTGRGNFCRGGP